MFSSVPQGYGQGKVPAHASAAVPAPPPKPDFVIDPRLQPSGNHDDPCIDGSSIVPDDFFSF